MSEYIRVCPNCGREIKYKWKCDFLKASKKGSICKSCAVSKSTIFKIGHNLNDFIIRNNHSFDELLLYNLKSSFEILSNDNIVISTVIVDKNENVVKKYGI